MSSPRTTRRRLALSALLGGLILLVLEGLSWLGLSWVHHHPASWAGLEEQRAAARSDGGALAVNLPDLPRRHRDEQVIHPFLGFVIDPERSPAARWPGRDRDAIQLGFPWNEEHLFQPQDGGTVVVALFGGSVAVGLVQDPQQSLKRALSALPNLEGRRLILLCLASMGYKQPQQLATLNYFLALGGRVDVVLNLDGFNEVALPPAELVPRGAFVHLPQSWIARAAPFDPDLQAKVGELAAVRARQSARAAAFSRRPWRWSFTAGVLWTVLDRGYAIRARALETELASWDPDKLGYIARGPRLSGKTADTAMADIVDLWQRSSRQMHALAQGLGLRYIHFLQPNQYDPGSKPLSEEEKRSFYQADHPYRPGVEAGYPLLRRAGEELRASGVAFFDLSRIFATTEETLYTDSCCHLNSKGSALLAQAIADALAQHDLPPPR